MTNKILLIDTSGYIYRAYHATPPLSNSKGTLTNATLGFTRMILKMLQAKQPAHLGFCIDSRTGSSTRKAIYPEYKANRVAATDVHSQINDIYRILDAMNMPMIDYQGWEADDVVATLCAKLAPDPVEILTSDKDFVQLLDMPNVSIFDPAKGKEIDEYYVLERYGISKNDMLCYQTLVGDKADNIPNLPFIGPKTAANLVNSYKTIEAMQAANKRGDIKNKRTAEALAMTEVIERNASLVKFNKALDINVTKDSLVRKEFNDVKLRAIFEELEFKQLIAELWEELPTW